VALVCTTVRPDGYIDFCCQIAEANQLNIWLARVSAGKLGPGIVAF